MRIGRRRIDVSNREKVFFPDAGITKGDLVDYYHRIGETMLPHVKDRPVVMQRFPDGIRGEGFYHKDMPAYFPEWIERVEVRKEGGTVTHVVADEVATLVYLADQGCITPHVWLSRTDRLDHPDRLVLDLDPPDDDFGLVRHGARDVMAFFEGLGATPHVMTTGSRGLHLLVPLDRSADFDTVRGLAQDIAAELERRDPERYTTAARKSGRGGRLYLDVARNSWAQTTVAPYAVRPRPGAPVAVPLSADELDDADLDPQGWDIGNVFRRLGQKDDPWTGIGRHGVAASTLRARLDELLGSDDPPADRGADR